MGFFHYIRETFQFTMENLFDIVLVTLAWLALLIPVITIPGATVAVYYFARQGLLQEEAHFRDFVDGLQKHFWKGWKIVLPYALLIALLTLSIASYLASEQPAIRILASVPMAAFSLLLILGNYVFVFFVKEDGALWPAIKKAFLLTASNLPFSLALLALTLLYFLGLSVTRIGLAIVYFGPVAVFQSKAVQHLLAAHGLEF